jgi:thiamine transport system substrate-binding protein
MERKFVIGLIAICAIVAGGAVFFTFSRYNRAYNESGLRPKLVVYTYSSFQDAMGPGPEIIKKFKEICLCDIEVVDAGSGRVLLEKMVLGNEKHIDVVIGFDQLTLKDALRKVKWRTLTPPPGIAWDPRIKPAVYANFLPYDWAPLTFVYREGELASDPHLLKWVELLPKNSVALQDPALSSPGLQFVYWLYALSTDESFVQFFKALRPKIHSISAKWADSYSVFQSGHARGVFTYITSLVYHWVEEKDRRYKVIEFDEGHPQQIEFMGVPNQCMSCGIAEEFVQFMLKPENQKIIMQKNYMLPVISGVVDGTAFAELPSLKLIDTKKMDEFVDKQAEIVDRWEKAVK